MSLIKEALDKAQKEGQQPAEEVRQRADELDPTTETPPQQSEGSGITTSFILTSVLIVLLAAIIGGQIVLLLSMLIR